MRATATRTFLATTALVLGLAALVPASAKAQDDAGPISFTGSVAFTTDYVFRGVSQTNQDPAVQGALNLNHESGFFIGAWGTNVNFTDASLEIDFTAGYTNTVDALSYSVFAIYYKYPGANESLNYDYWEGAISLSYDAGMFIPSFSAFYSPEFFGDTGDAYYLTGGLKVKPVDNVAIYGNVGRQIYERRGLTDATDFNVGVTVSVIGIDLDVKYVSHSDEALGDISDDRVIFTVSKAF